MNRRTLLKLPILALATSAACAYDITKIVNKTKMKKVDPMKPERYELSHSPEIKVGNIDEKGFVKVEVTVGQEGIIHPSSEDHWIYKVDLYANGKKVSSVDIEAGISSGYLASKVKKEGLKELRAIAMCNLHGQWEEIIKL